MAKRLVMIHTVHSLPTSFGKLCDELLPGVDVEHVVDEDLLRETLQAGQLTDDVRRRFAARAEAAMATSPDAVVLTCSSVGPAADGLPVYRIDAAMADRAVEMGRKIGVAASVPTTLRATSDLIRAAADRAGRSIEIRTGLAEGAFAALGQSDLERHDRLVRATLDDLAGWADVVVLAQASMARALAGADAVLVGGRRVPVLTSPRLGVERLREVLGVG